MDFIKMEAAGNDFVIFNGFKYDIEDYSNLAKKACDRHFSIGGDGMIVCEKSNIADVKMVYYNSDGSRGEMCGNGIRCFAKYVYEEGIVISNVFTVDTLAGIKKIWLETDYNKNVKKIMVYMGKPMFNANEIPVKIEKDRVIEEEIIVDNTKLIFSSLLVGVPHTVIFVNDIKNIDINELGRKIETNPLFPNKTNVNFVEVITRSKINNFTWERGAGRTLGCGTGSCASAVIGYMTGRLDKKVEIKTEGGELTVEIEENYDIYMKGSANKISSGTFFNLV